MWYMYAILFNLKNEWNSNACYNMDELWKYYTKWNKTDAREQILYDSTYMKYLE